MGTLPGVLSQSMADAAGRVRALTETEVLPASLQVAADVHQGCTVREQWTFQDLLTDTLGKNSDPGLVQSLGSPKSTWVIPEPTALLPTLPSHSSQGSQICWNSSSEAQAGCPGIAL